MKIAVPFENEEIFQHFGHAAQFKLYEVVSGEIVGTELLDAEGTGHEALAGLLAQKDVALLICGGIGAGAEAALSASGISMCTGVSGSADDAVKLFLQGGLQCGSGANCDHHHEESSGCGCGGGCGSCGGGCSGCGDMDDYVETRTFSDIVHLTYDNFEQEVLADPGYICIDFWATWCQPCKMMAPIFEEANLEQPKVKFCKVDVDAQPELAQLFGIESIPTVVLVHKRRTLTGFVGVRDKEALLSIFEGYVK